MPVYWGMPFAIDARGRVATSDRPRHLYDMIYQVLFTRPGERVNRPDFGCGLGNLVFEPNSDEMAAELQARIRGGLQRWLSDVIVVESVSVANQDERLMIEIEYVSLDNGQRMSDQFTTL